VSNIRKVTEIFSVSEQVLPSQMEKIAELGFKTIIDNRPDGESFDQPNFVEIERVAQELGLKAIYIPVVNGQPTEAAAKDLKAALGDTPTPVLAYCRSGGRSMALWTQAMES
jgi:sulfide:quinone oxidoreductase